MSNSTLNITKQLSNSQWVITATISPGGFLPLEIFVYENLGTTSLGDFQGTVAAIDLPRIQIFTGTIIPAFGNKFVRYGVGTIYVGQGDDPDLVISHLVDSVQILSTTLQAIANSTKAYTIT